MSSAHPPPGPAGGPPAGIGDQVRAALEAADLEAFRELLDPRVRWGAPGDPAPPCQTREQVLGWYRRGREAGTRAQVTEVVAAGDKVLVGMTVTFGPGTPQAGASDHQTAIPRWQVLTVAAGRVVDIRGYDDRSAAAAQAGVRD